MSTKELLDNSGEPIGFTVIESKPYPKLFCDKITKFIRRTIKPVQMSPDVKLPDNVHWIQVAGDVNAQPVFPEKCINE